MAALVGLVRPSSERSGHAPSRTIAPRGHRLVFANQLRGLAALSVVVSHLIGVYWGGREIVAAATATPVAPGEVSRLFWLVAHPWFNFGPFGVALFFLISGLVVPISLEQHTRATFLLARLLRIVPTYLVATAASLLVVWANARSWNLPFPGATRTVVANLLLIQDVLSEPDMSLVSWTLAIELKFYVVMALCSTAIRSGSVSTLFVIAFAALVANLATTSPFFSGWVEAWPSIVQMLSFESTYIVFMLLGVLFNYHLRGKISMLRFLANGAGMSVMFLACWCSGPNAGQYPVVTVNYLYALVGFGALFLLRERVPRLRILDGLAAISFPLYLIHSLIGYSSIKVLTLAVGLSYRVSLAATLLVMVALATAIHFGVERWSIGLGKRLSRRPAGRDPMIAGPVTVGNL